MRKLNWALIILIIAIWSAILFYWIGTEKSQPAAKETPENSTTLSPSTVPMATDSGGSSPSGKVFQASSSSILLTAPAVTVKY